MADKVKTLAYGIQQKTEVGQLYPDPPVNFGADFKDIVETEAKYGHPYTLRQFFDNYMDFMQSADFIYYGTAAPSNSHVKIWIDTSTTNQATWK